MYIPIYEKSVYCDIFLPDAWLSDDGVGFSFRPYQISCGADGDFHFVVTDDKYLIVCKAESQIPTPKNNISVTSGFSAFYTAHVIFDAQTQAKDRETYQRIWVANENLLLLHRPQLARRVF